MRKSNIYLIFTLVTMIAFCGLVFIYPQFAMRHHRDALAKADRLVQELGITDLCLFTEARYTRHISQADLFSAFQDHPGAYEHFPSGSMVKPPSFLFTFPTKNPAEKREDGK